MSSKVMVEKLEMVLAVLWIGGFISIVPFAIGIILSADGIHILAYKKHYKAGVLNVDSIASGPTGNTKANTIDAIGYADSVLTALSIGSSESPHVQALVLRFSRQEKIDLLVWYKPDGKLTISRRPDESKFPANRIRTKVFQNVLIFNAPLVLILVARWSIARKIKKIKK